MYSIECCTKYKVVEAFKGLYNLVVDNIEYRDTNWIVSQLIENQRININIFLSYCKMRDIEMLSWDKGSEMYFPGNTLYFYDYTITDDEIIFENLVSYEYTKRKIIERMKEGNFSAYIGSHGVYCSGRSQSYQKDEIYITIQNGNVSFSKKSIEYPNIDVYCRELSIEQSSLFDIYIKIDEDTCSCDNSYMNVKVGEYEVEFPTLIDIPTDELFYILNFSHSVEKRNGMEIIRNNKDEITHIVIREFIFTMKKFHNIQLDMLQLEALQEAFGFSYIIRNAIVNEEFDFYTMNLVEVDGKDISPTKAFKTVILDQEKDTHGNNVILYRSYIYFGIKNGEFNVLPIYYLQVTCPSTGNIHYLPVLPDTRTCREGLAFTFQIESYNPEIES